MKKQKQRKVVWLNPKREAGEKVYTFRRLMVKVDVCELCGHHKPIFETRVVPAVVLAVSEDRAVVGGNVVVKCLYRVRCLCDDPSDFYEADDDGSKLFTNKSTAEDVLGAKGEKA